MILVYHCLQEEVFRPTEIASSNKQLQQAGTWELGTESVERCWLYRWSSVDSPEGPTKFVSSSILNPLTSKS